VIERIILHAGTPKTGTTSLQRALHGFREALGARGVFIPPTTVQQYPTPDGRLEAKPKHQWMVGALTAPTAEPFLVGARRALEAAQENAHTAILSTEGLYHHWWDFSDGGKAGLAEIAKRHRVELWVWFRSPLEFFKSSYVQMLKNPLGKVSCYGKDLSPAELLADPWFARRLDYAGFVREASEVLGRDAVRPFAWRNCTVRDFLSALGHGDLAAEEPREHPTLGTVGVAMLRLVNARVLANPVKAEAVRLISQIDAALGDASPEFDLDAESRARVVALSCPGLAWLRQEWDLDLTST
jgi:hypothetical protein